MLGVAAGKDDAAAMSSKTHSKQEVEQQNRFGYMFEQSDDGMASDSLEVTQQVFPSSEAGKKVVVFRTNFARLGVNRATVHFSADDVYGCDRGQCDRFHYVFDAGTTKTIPIYISKNGIDIPDEVMYVEVDL